MTYKKCTLPKPGKKVKQLRVRKGKGKSLTPTQRVRKGKGKSLTPTQRQKAITDFNNSW